MKLNIKYIYILSALFLCELTLAQTVTAQVKKQVQEKCLYHFDDLQRKQTWTESYNAAGLHFLDFNNSSYIEAYMGKNDGPFVKFNESDNSFNYGLRTASYTKVKKTTFFGMIDYNNFKGQNMTWSGLIYPERYLMLVADDRPAVKSKESYKLTGGLSLPLHENLFFGLQINYEAAMLAKRKDLRHRTDLLDFETTAGLMYKTEMFNIGLNYYYRKFHEKVEFSKVADDDVLYTGYLLKGLWFGMIDIWNQRELNLSRSFIDVIQGGSLQVEFVKDNFRFHNEFTYKFKDGLSGPGIDRAYTQNEGTTLEYKGIAQYELDNMRHYLKIKTNYTDAVNYDKVSNTENIGGISTVIQYGKNKAFAKRSFDMSAEYELALGKFKCSPEWNFKAGYQYSSYSAVSSLVVPFYFTQEVNITTGYGKVNKNFLMQKGMIDLSLMGGYSMGNGDRLKMHTAAGASNQISDEIVPKQKVEMLKREYEYMTKGKLLGEVGFRYSKFVMKNRTAGSIYLDTKYSFTSASDLKYHTGGNAGIFSLALGYSF
ncbi:MAG: hypothetical protein Q8S23_05295 [Bacteroidales bacterium]|nr:hypothetical protein [Bacteroidales bacterium]